MEIFFRNRLFPRCLYYRNKTSSKAGKQAYCCIDFLLVVFSFQIGLLCSNIIVACLDDFGNSHIGTLSSPPKEFIGLFLQLHFCVCLTHFLIYSCAKYKGSKSPS